MTNRLPGWDSLAPVDRELLNLFFSNRFDSNGRGGDSRLAHCKDKIRNGANVNAVFEPNVGSKHLKYFPFGMSPLRRSTLFSTMELFALFMSMPEIDVNAGYPLWGAIKGANLEAVMILLEHRDLDLLSRTCPVQHEDAKEDMTALEFAMFITKKEHENAEMNPDAYRSRETIECLAKSELVAKMVQDEVKRRER